MKTIINLIASSSGSDTGLSRRQPGFDPPRDHQMGGGEMRRNPTLRKFIMNNWAAKKADWIVLGFLLYVSIMLLFYQVKEF